MTKRQRERIERRAARARATLAEQSAALARALRQVERHARGGEAIPLRRAYEESLEASVTLMLNVCRANEALGWLASPTPPRTKRDAGKDR